MPSDAERKDLLASLPSVDELLKGPEGRQFLSRYPRTLVVRAIREVLAVQRASILSGAPVDSIDFGTAVDTELQKLSSFSLRPVINATGIVVHTNLGRSILSDAAIDRVVAVARGYSNLEYDIPSGRRGKRHTHTARLLREITSAEDAVIVNNNAAAVFICLSTFARGREVVVSRGELVEIGGSFRIPDVMAASGAILREVGTTNKTHLTDYEAALGSDTALLLKVHQSNYRLIGFTKEVPVAELVTLGRQRNLPVMFDLGSGSLLDLKPFGIHDEPSVQEIIKAGVDIVTFSGDKLLGGPQGGIIVGRKELVEQVRKNPLARAVRVDKMTIAAFESVLMDYRDSEHARLNVPVLRMLFQDTAVIRARARKLASALRQAAPSGRYEIVGDTSMAGGGSLPERAFPTFAVAIQAEGISVNELERRLRSGMPPVVARIRDNTLLLDARTLQDAELATVAAAVAAALTS